ncbi:HET-domain-containing protein [Lophium mytilinum]|uniref:HET-domain-containing protein n=1 Tax=Lophium mytilinum TaxID=390894 RepID=A0A6A6Q9T8_9PEZI|nr:HET-domain-containing protein [Lophium mytilinum]
MATSSALDPQQRVFSTLPLSKEPAEIRQLLLQPEPDNADTEHPIVCSLRRLALEDEAEYVALSYVWGLPNSRTKSITLNSHLFPITENLHEALLHLRKAKDRRHLWIDAICINQSDAEEKTTQVQLMRHIYQKASAVVIWLGPSTPATDTAFEWIDKLGGGLLDIGLWDLGQDELQGWDGVDCSTEPNPRIAKVKRDVSGYMQTFKQWVVEGKNPFSIVFPADLKQRAWFTRAWCLQELANARIAIFRCGDREVEYTKLWAVVFFFNVFGTWAGRHLRTGNLEIDLRSMRILEDAVDMPTVTIGLRRKKLKDLAHPDLRLKNLLIRVNTVKMFDSVGTQIKATYPKDRVYALLGIANDPVAQEIVPDYSDACSVEEAYIDTAKALLRNGNIDILMLCRKRGGSLALPSWVPDWTADNREPWCGDMEKRWFSAGRASERGSVQPEPRFQDDRIELRGCVVDSIADLGAVWSRGIMDTFDYDAARKVLENIATFLTRSSKYDDNQKAGALWRIPIGDLESGGVVNWPQRATSPAKDAYDAMRQAVEDPALRGKDHGSSHAAFIAYMGRMQRMYDSRPFLSKEGYVGLCPMEAEKEDVIVVILGAQVPFVVRKREDGAWRLVGEAHVSGIMDGEWLREDREIGGIVLR